MLYLAETNESTPDPVTATFDADNPSVIIDTGSPPIGEDPLSIMGVNARKILN